MLILSICTLAFSVYFIYSLYPDYRNSAQKISFSTLTVSFFSGILCLIPTILIVNLLYAFINSLCFSNYMVYLIFYNFIVIALTEELCKFFVIRAIIWKHPVLHHPFWGVVCGITAALGFALFENLLYIFKFGFTAAVLRTFTATPSHIIFGLLSGYFLSAAKIYENTGNLSLKRRYLCYAVVLPALAHGIYDFSLSVNSDLLPLFFLAFITKVEMQAFKHFKYMQASSEFPNS